MPGNLRMAWEAHKKWGKLPWADLFQPAIRLAVPRPGLPAGAGLIDVAGVTLP